ncbi:hypothetical protein K1T71_014664 [Dendrolimus kikuchii]|uniref:Uncharacterized protein n=1 Tax=Dendrolimus kikuchii TaxID=765133 RepID=A0ACC1CEN7_9NEOP|nr:hypothetical protein K1T71_014664 [Dendrolimus kikuchii]
MLKEMRYGTRSVKKTNKKKKINVIPGRSVENIISTEETEDLDATKELSDDESNTEDINLNRFNLKMLEEPGPSKGKKGFKDLSPSHVVDDDDIPLAKMIQSPTDEDNNVPLAQLRRFTATEPRIEIEEFIGIDDNVAVCALATEEEIIAEAESNNRNTDEENEDRQVRQEQFQPTTICESLNAITVLQKFVAFNDQFNTDDTLTTMKRKIQNIFETQLTKKQTKMTDYFKN